jgi:hypothetical protein
VDRVFVSEVHFTSVVVLGDRSGGKFDEKLHDLFADQFPRFSIMGVEKALDGS